MHSQKFDNPYVLEENTKRYLCDIEKHENLSLIYVNIRRSMNFNFQKLLDFLINCLNSINLICVTGTWSTGKDCKDNLKFYSQSFDFTHQVRKTGNKRGGILI